MECLNENRCRYPAVHTSHRPSLRAMASAGIPLVGAKVSAATGAADPVIRYHLGMVYLRLGDKRGEPTLRAALKSAPDLPEAGVAKELLGKSGK